MTTSEHHEQNVLRLVRASALTTDTAQSPGMERRAAISFATTGSSRIWLGENHMAGAMRSADHHHGDSETAIYVLAGHPNFVCLAAGVETSFAASPGDYIFIPPFLPHREENPGPEEAVLVIARSSQEAIVINLPSLAG